jgi:SAM-dependent methyltransferase
MPNNEAVVETSLAYLYHSGGLVPWLTRIAHRVVSLVDSTNGLVLDLGCGDGAHFPYYRLGQRVVAVDLDQVLLDKASSNIKDNIKLVRVDITKGLPFPSNSIDCCIASGILEHLLSMKDTILDVQRVLKVGGYLIVLQVSEGLAYKMGRKFTTARDMKKQGIDYYRYIKSEHVNTTKEVLGLLDRVFTRSLTIGIPSIIPEQNINAYLVVKYIKRKDEKVSI